jgi:two-component system copper resistance phosphate regulon response regulator CusR
MRILLAEDQDKVAHHIASGLREASYAVDIASDGDEALWMAANHPYDMIVMDIMMPCRDGISAVRTLRRKGVSTPVIMLTARSEVEDRVAGLDAGADDYLTKPFSITELLARMRAVWRRQRGDLNTRLRVGDLELDLVARSAARNGRDIPLTNREFALLEFLMTCSPRPVSKTAIVEHVWDQCFDSGSNVVNVYIRHLRSKIEQNGEAPLLHTIRGLGFVLREAPP